MSEFIIIQVGQCGNQIGSSLLPQILQEYDITTKNNTTRRKNDKAELQQYMSSFFNLTSKRSTYNKVEDLITSNAKARVICIDMEDSVVARFKSGMFRNLYDKRSLITNYPGSGNNWAEGYCSHGPKFKDKILKSIQYNLEQCDNLQGFLLLFSVGGGTGSGLGSYTVRLLANYYPTIERFVACVYPTGTEDVITCPYNMAFASQELLNNATCVFPVENRTLMDIAMKQINRNSKYPSSFKPFDDINGFIVDMILHLTSGSRFSGAMNFDMNDINTNMVPFPKMNFLLSGFSPLINSKGSESKYLKNEIFASSCNRANLLAKIDPFDISH